MRISCSAACALESQFEPLLPDVVTTLSHFPRYKQFSSLTVCSLSLYDNARSTTALSVIRYIMLGLKRTTPANPHQLRKNVPAQ